MDRGMKRKLSLFFGVTLLAALFAAPSFAAGNAYFELNRAAYPEFFRDGETQAIFSPTITDSWIREEVWVEIPLDSDGDGKRDLLCARIRRPRATTVVNPGTFKCPVIVEASPYHNNSGTNPPSTALLVDMDSDYSGTGNPSTLDRTYRDVENFRRYYKDIVDANFKPDWLPAERTSAGLSRDGTPITVTVGSNTTWIGTMLSRGVAYIQYAILGSARAEGVLPVGGYDENIAAAAVVDWLNGRVKAYTNTTDNIEVKAYWATGDAAFTGTSYNGAMSIEAAVTGVEGVKTILPIAPPVNWYEYYRSNAIAYSPGGYPGEDMAELMAYCWGRGYAATSPVPPSEAIWDLYFANIVSAIVDSDRTTGDYNSYWDERNHTKYVDNIRGSVLVMHGFNDENVKLKNSAMLWEACKKFGIPIKAIFHQGRHTTPWSYDGLDFVNKVHKWMDYHLWGIDNGAMEDIPNVMLQNNSGEWEEHDDWPISDNYQKLYFKGTSRTGSLSINMQKEPVEQSFVDTLLFDLTRPALRATMNQNQIVQWKRTLAGGDRNDIATCTGENPIPNNDSLLFITDILEDTRIDGTVKVTAKIAANKNVGAVSAMLIDYGMDNYMLSLPVSGTGQPGTSSQSVPGAINLKYPNQATSADTLVNASRLIQNTVQRQFNIITRGSVDVQNPNYNGKIWLDSPETNYIPEYFYQTTAIVPGTFYSYTWDLDVTSYRIKAGHKLGVVVYGTDIEYTHRPFNPTTFTMEVGPGSYVSLPIVGAFKSNETPDPVEPQPITPETAFGGSANIPAGASVAADVLVWNTEFTDEGDVLTGSALDGWTIYDFSPKGGNGWTASLADGKITVKFSGDVTNQEIQVYVSNANTALNDGILKVRFSGKATVVEPPKKPTGGGGGCNAAYPALALLALLPFAVRKRS